MKFERTLIPVVYGSEKIKQIIDDAKVDDRFYISAVRPGIKCLIINGLVCDLNGDPFGNIAFQDRFNWFTERLRKSSFIAVGNIVIDSTSLKARYSSNLHSMISHNSAWTSAAFDSVFIELQDIHQPIHSASIKYRTRVQVMDGMSRRGNTEEQTVRLQAQFRGNKKSYKEIYDFLLENSRRGNMVSFQDGEDNYISGVQKAPFSVFEVSLLEPFMGTFLSARESESYVATKGEVCNIVDFVRVSYEGSIHSISFLSATKEQSLYLSELIRKELLIPGKSKFPFLAIKDGDILSLPKKI